MPLCTFYVHLWGTAMPRPAKLWRRGQNGFYYTKIDGKQHRLSVDYEESLDLFHNLRQGRKKRKPTGKIQTTLDAAKNAFLSHAKRTKAEQTVQNQTAYLESFCAFAGAGRRVFDIKPDELDEWVLSQKWGPSTQSAAKRTVPFFISTTLSQ